MSKIKVNRLENTATAAGGIDIDSSGKCGIGTAAPGAILDIKHNSANEHLRLTELTSGKYSALGVDTSDNLRIYANNAERLRILSSGGLTFNGDTAAANALDDYEEGAWTPGVDTGTISASNARYIKIGNLVKVCAVIQSFSDRSSSNAVLVNNLPYATSTAQLGGSMMGRNLDRTAFTTYVRNDDQKMEFYSIGSSAFAVLQHLHINSSNAVMYFQASYIIT